MDIKGGINKQFFAILKSYIKTYDMNRILNKPYQSIWGTIPLILGLSMIGINSAIDLQLHDTYFVIASIHIGILFSFILGIIGSIYWLIRHKKLINWMTLFHVMSTISTFVLIIITGLVYKEAIGGDFDTFRIVKQILVTLILIALFSQVIFMTNLVLSLISNKNKN